MRSYLLALLLLSTACWPPQMCTGLIQWGCSEDEKPPSRPAKLPCATRCFRGRDQLFCVWSNGDTTYWPPKMICRVKGDYSPCVLEDMRDPPYTQCLPDGDGGAL